MKRKALTLTLISMLLISLLLVASVPSLKAVTEEPQVQWSRSYGAVGSLGNSMVQTADGGYVIAGYNSTGYSNLYHTYLRKPVLIKTDSSGNVQWEKTYEPENLKFDFIVQTSDLGYALFGYGEITKIDAEGNLQWHKTYTPLPGGISISKGIQTSDGGYLLVGTTSNSSYPQNAVAWILKTDNNGEILWKKTFGDVFSSSIIATCAYAVIETNNGEYVVGGDWEGDCWLLKIDSNGNIQWNKTHDFRYTGTAGEYKYTSISKTNDGGLILTGFATPIPFLVKVDSQGNMQWNSPYSEFGWFTSVVERLDGGFFAVGVLKDGWMVKTDSSGTLLWNSTYGDPTRRIVPNRFDSVVRTSDGGYAVAGTVNYTIWLFKFASEPNDSAPFPTTWIVAAVIIAVVTVAVAGLGLLVYLIKRK